jgi:NAD-dependent dihydropyrimidine dehydrogenase PreA subunit
MLAPDVEHVMKSAQASAGEPEGGKVHILEDNRDDCVGCMACETQCPEECITITED